MEVFRALGMRALREGGGGGLIGLQTVESKREGGACSLVFFPETNFGATACVDVTLDAVILGVGFALLLFGCGDECVRGKGACCCCRMVEGGWGLGLGLGGRRVWGGGGGGGGIGECGDEV